MALNKAGRGLAFTADDGDGLRIESIPQTALILSSRQAERRVVILGEIGAEQLLGQGDMLYMAGGGRISRVHGPFCSDEEVEKVVRHLKTQGAPEYLEAVTAEDPSEEDGAVFDSTGMGGDGGGDLFAQAVAIVKRDRKASTSYIQRRLQIGYNRAASLMERMELEGIVGQANHAGKREILVPEEETGF